MGKKKGAGNKLARMSEEERARYLQHRAEIEEEARRRKQQLIAIFMKNKLKREDAFSRLNLAKINQEWRSILRNIKCVELKDEIKSVEQYFNDALNRKNQVIQRLLSDLDENEELYATMLHTHMENIETLISIHGDRIDFWKKSYQSEKNLLLDEYHEEIQVYKNRSNNAHSELEHVFHGLQSKAEREKDLSAENHLNRMDNIKSCMILKLDQITQDRELKMEQLWHEFQIILNEYLRHTEEFHNEYVDMRQKDDEDTKCIRMHYAEVGRSTDIIADMKFNLDSCRTEQRLQIVELTKYKNQLQTKHYELKLKMENELKIDRDNLRWMVVCASKSNMKLKKLLTKGEHILQIAEICRKLETEREKVTPFSRKKIMFEKDENELKKPPEDFKEETMTILSKMENFWIRYNSVRIDCACLVEEKAALKKENHDLKMKLKLYLTNVTIAGGGGDAKDKLRPSSMKVDKIGHMDYSGFNTVTTGICKLRRRPVTCIEGNLCNAVRSAALVKGKLAMNQKYYYNYNY